MITSFFRRSRLWTTEEELWLAALQRKVSPEITAVKIERRFLVDSSRALRNDELDKLKWLLKETFEPEMFKESSMLDAGYSMLDGKTEDRGQKTEDRKQRTEDRGQKTDSDFRLPTSDFRHLTIEIGPRLAIVTPKSTNAVSICSACGLDSIKRIEQTTRYLILDTRYSTRIKNQESRIETEQRKNKISDFRFQISDFIHDRMTEQPYLEPPISFEQETKPEPVQLIPLLERGTDVLEDANEKLGLALDKQMMLYILDYYQKLGRNPTDVELFMFGQLNSEHCRHHLFNGTFIIDDRRMDHSLFDMIRSTTKASQGNVIVAYEDNAAATSSKPLNMFIPSNPIEPSAFTTKIVKICDAFKVETHNHPTTISADPGAGTGLGGNIRDIQGVGCGGTVLGALAIYNVANLFINGYELPWEKEYAPHPSRFQTPLEIIIEASNGASDYGNKFGVPLTTGSCTSFELMCSGEHYGWRKTCMVAGNWGLINEAHAYKKELRKGYLVVQIGGDRYPIGLGGGSGSSKDAGGQEAELDFDSVQRANPEMENRNESVIRACAELGDKSPIISITDLGAGGECVALPEIVHPHGAKYEIRNIPCGDKTMSVLVFWCNESQESMIMIVTREGLPILEQTCKRNRCPMYVVGEVTGDGKLVLTDKDAPKDATREQQVPIDLDMEFLLANLPEMTIECQSIPRQLSPVKLPEGLEVLDALERVLRLLKVGSKHFLTRKVDRSVGGLSVQQQTVGPLQLTLADCAVTARSFFGITGIVAAIGEQPIKGLVNTKAGGRMSLGESLTNLVWALIEDFASVNFSATWQWPCKQPGEDARFHQTVEAATELCKDLGLRIPVGKDSVSMTAWTVLEGRKHPIKSPGTVQMISFAPCPDITKVITPDIKMPGKSVLIMLDLSGGKRRLGGSALAQVYEQIGDEAPDVDNPHLLRKAFEAVQELIREGLVLSGHDVSDGGLISCLLEMAFAGNCGLDINLDNSNIFGRYDVFASLFAEELGLVFETLPANLKRVDKILQAYGFNYDKNTALLGQTTSMLDARCSILVENRESRIENRESRIVLDADMRELRGIWQQTSYVLDKLQANPACVEAERKANFERKGPHYELFFNPAPTPREKMEDNNKPKVAILREVGTNGAREMAGAFFAAGFEPWDVTMADIADGRVSLKDFRGVAFSGGFSFADVLDAGKGWAGVIMFNDRIRDEFKDFIERLDTFSLGVCNGCQVMALLGWVPWQGIDIKQQPRFVRNESGIFESRFVTVKINPSPSIFLSEMEGSVLGIWVAHAQGRCLWPDQKIFSLAMLDTRPSSAGFRSKPAVGGSILDTRREPRIQNPESSPTLDARRESRIQNPESSLAPIRFVDDDGKETEQYPFNPNGSRLGVTGICSRDGRHLALMPHPERLFQVWQWPFWPTHWSGLKASPWLKLFQNAREWCKKNPA